MLNLEELIDIAGPPTKPSIQWLRSASSGIDYLVQNSRSEEIIIFAIAGQMLSQSVLVPIANVTPPDGNALQHAWVDPAGQWALGHESGGGRPDRMFLSPPIDSYGCDALRGAERLVFRRHFDGVDKGVMRTEMSQTLVQALGLYWLDEEKAYCKLDDDGDVQQIIRIRDLSDSTGERSSILITIDAEQLHRYMAVTETALLTKFDFTRYPPGSFLGWHSPQREEVNENDLFYHTGVQTNGSFANGALILRPVLTKEMLIARANAEWKDHGREYAVFKAHDWKNDRLIETSCAPWALASYFERESSLPFQVTPAFFRPDVLQKYKSDPEKYKLDHRSIHSRGGWYLKSYDVNEAGQVHAYLYDLARLPYNEQIYWQSFNEWPKAPISPRAFKTDIQGDFCTIPDSLIDLKHEISKLDKIMPDYWSPRGEALASAVHYPLTASTEEWSNAILALDQLVVEGFAVRPLRKRVTVAGREFDKQWGSLRLLEEALSIVGLDEEEARELVAPLRVLHDIRSKAKGHAAGSEKAALVKSAKTEHGSLAVHFRVLTSNIQESFDKIVELL